MLPYDTNEKTEIVCCAVISIIIGIVSYGGIAWLLSLGG